MEWLFALAALLGISFSGPLAKGKKKMNSNDLSKWPEKWGYAYRKPRPTSNIPTADQIAAVEKAVIVYPKVPARLLFALEKRETDCQDIKGASHGMNSTAYRNSYERYRKKLIPGSNITWGKMFPTAKDWRPYSAWQLNPYHLVPDFVPPGAPLSELLNPYKAAMGAARYLTNLFNEHGNFHDALLHYNGDAGWRYDVEMNYAALGGKLLDLGTPNV